MRIVWKFSRVLGGVLAVLSLLYFIWTFFGSTTIDGVGEGDVIYDQVAVAGVHQFVVDPSEPKSSLRAVEDSIEFVPNRIRTLKTSYGIVQVKDLLFVPVEPLKKGQNLPQFSNPMDDAFRSVFLGAKAKGLGLAPAKSDQPDSSKFYSLLQRLQAKGEDRAMNRDGNRNLNSEKMLALQTQLLARESQSMKKDVNKERNVHEREEKLSKLQFESTRCKRRLCAEYLTSTDLPHFRFCMKKSKLRSELEPVESKCNFMNGTGRSPVALASHPGSGHLFVRELLQKNTGICTGGVNCDVALRRNGYPGECLRSGVVLVVKTHQRDPRWTGIRYDNSTPNKGFNKAVDIPVYGSAILVVRDPFDALADLWHRMKAEGIITGKCSYAYYYNVV